MILQTRRLRLRELEETDLDSLRLILQDAQTMTAYAHAFSEQEVRDWLDRQRRRYREDGFGLWAVEDRETGEFLGQTGLTYQDWNGRRVVEVGYLFRRDRWHKGYATEAAMACRDYAFSRLGCEAVYSIIRDTNEASRRVALRNGMRKVGAIVKHYYGIDMPHDVYEVERPAMLYQVGIIPGLDRLAELYAAVGWAHYAQEPERLLAAVAGSLCVVTAWQGEELVGLARAVGDGISILYVQDLLVREAFRRQGIGRAMLEQLTAAYPQVRQKVLLADNTPQAEGFYRALGFAPAQEGGMVCFVRMDAREKRQG